jgi:predicted phage gp36 major capsid-like protein
MAETDEKAGAAGGGATRESGSTGEEQSRQHAEEESEMRAEEDSAKAMEAEVPHSTGYDDPGQEPPSDSGEGETA